MLLTCRCTCWKGAADGTWKRAMEATDLPSTSQTRMYDIGLISAINNLSQRVLSTDLLPEFRPPEKGTGNIYYNTFNIS